MAGIDFTAAANRMIDSVQAGLADAADTVKAEAVQRTPLEVGDLRRSAFTDVDGLTAVIAYSSEYAVPQHERLDYHHQDGEAKFLENALIAKRQVVGQILAQAIRRGMQ